MGSSAEKITTCGCTKSHHTEEYVKFLKERSIWLDEPYYELELTHQGVQLVRVHYRIEGSSSSKWCPNCGSRDTANCQLAAVEGYNWGWMCNKCGMYGIPMDEWFK
jgi:predicted RNA-binding Zn-ribbon protein involved in translation (DUF1610 family)